MICTKSERQKSAQNQCTKMGRKSAHHLELLEDCSEYRDVIWLIVVYALESIYPGLASLALIIEVCQNRSKEHLAPQ